MRISFGGLVVRPLFHPDDLMAGLTASAKAMFEEEIGYSLSRRDDRRAFEDWLTSDEFVPDRHQPPDQIYVPTPWVSSVFPAAGPTSFDWDQFFDRLVEAAREKASPAPKAEPEKRLQLPNRKRRQPWEKIVARFPFDRLEPLEYEDASGELVGPCFIIPLDRPASSLVARANRELAPRRFTHRRVCQEVGGVGYVGYGVWRLK